MATTISKNTQSQKKVALIIANEKYTNPVNMLTKSRRNGSDMKTALEEIGFHVSQCDNLNDEAMKSKIKEFSIQCCKSKVVLLYVSGHVCQADHKNYLIPCDDNQIQDQADLEENANSLDRIIDRFNKELLKIQESSNPAEGKGSRLPVVIILLDYSKQYTMKNKESPNAKSMVPGLRRIERKDNIYIQFACDADTAPIGTTANHPNSLYTKHLLEHIRRGNMDVRKVLKWVSEGVSNESNGRQKPYSMDGLDENQTVFLNENLKPMAPREPDGPRNPIGGSFVIAPEAYPSPDPLPLPLPQPTPSKVVTIFGEHKLGYAKDRLRNPLGICLTDQYVLVADTLNHRVLMYNNRRNANHIKILAGNGHSGYTSNQLSGPTDMVYHTKSKSVLICDRRNRRVLQVPITSGRKPKVLMTNIACWGIAIDSSDNVYVSDTDRHAVMRFLLGKRQLETVAGRNGQGSRLNQLNHPTYIALGPADEIYISDSENNRVVKWNANDRTGTLVAGGKGRGKNLNQLDYPMGLAVDDFGTVYVADRWNHRIMKWFQNSSIGQQIVGNPYRADRGECDLNCPAGIKLDDGGYLYVADSQNQRIQKFHLELLD